MGACVSKSNSLSGAHANPPENTPEETVKGELTAADEEIERRSLGYLFNENKGEAPPESSSKETAEKEHETTNPTDSSGNDEKEKSLITDELASKSSEEKNTEDVKLSSQNADCEIPLKKAEEEISGVQNLETVEKSEDNDVVKAEEQFGENTERTEDQEPALPVEKDAAEVKLSDDEIISKTEEGPALELLQITKPDDENATATKPEDQVIEADDQKPALDEERNELQPCDTTTNVVESEITPETSETNNVGNKPALDEEKKELPPSDTTDLVASHNIPETSKTKKPEDKSQDFAEASTVELPKPLEEKILAPPLDADKQKTEDIPVENKNIEAFHKVPIDHQATEAGRNIEHEKMTTGI